MSAPASLSSSVEMDSVGMMEDDGRATDGLVAESDRSSINNSTNNGNTNNGNTGGSAKKPSKMQALEIESGDVDGYRASSDQHEEIELTRTNTDDAEDDNDDDNNDMEQLLPNSSPSRKSNRSKQSGASGSSTRSPSRASSSFCCNTIHAQRIGNMHIMFPMYHAKTGWGVLGPHWFGPLSVVGILIAATALCIRSTFHHSLGAVTASMCLGFLSICTVLLCDASFRDPGICRDTEIPEGTPENQLTQWRWCDFCSVYQPPDGAHCADCGVCIAGYDHHCVWMGTCIGKRNYRQFVRFNMSWLYYAAFAIFWIAVFGPLIFHTI